MRLGPVRFLETERIADDPVLGPLLLRHIIVKCPLFGLCVHKLCRSDYDRALHDHPWAFVSLVLSHGYVEVTPLPDGLEYPERSVLDMAEISRQIEGAPDRLLYTWRRPWSVTYRPAEWKHRVIIPLKRWPARTLIFMGPRVRRWGFWVPDESAPGRHRWCWWRRHNSKLNICEDEPIHQGGDD